MFQIENVIYVYVVVCVCMLLFNLVLAFYRRTSGMAKNKHIKEIRQSIEVQLEHIKKDEALDEAIQRKFSKKLGYSGWVFSFHEVIEEKLQTEHEVTQLYLIKSKPMFTILSEAYKKKDDMKKAYFAYLMSQYQVCKGIENDTIIENLMELIVSKSAYCRENALKALFRFGNEQNVVKALRRMSEQEIFHHDKLLTDGLLSFTGDKEALCSVLWEQFEQFSLGIKIPVINAIRAMSGNYKEVFYESCKKLELDKNIRIPMLRYFWKYPYEPAKELLEYCLNNETVDWELRAVSATVLQSYPEEHSIELLKHALNDYNWYVRYNAAESLYKLDIKYKELVSVYNGENRYAREMLEYQKEMKEIREKIRGGVLYK